LLAAVVMAGRRLASRRSTAGQLPASPPAGSDAAVAERRPANMVRVGNTCERVRRRQDEPHDLRLARFRTPDADDNDD
jgi:hypothetical protein